MTMLNANEMLAESKDGVTRHIVRSVQPIQSLQLERVEQGWHWVLESLSRLPQMSKLGAHVSRMLPIPDTVLFENGVPTKWLFCGMDGVGTRPSRSCTIEVVRRKFGAVARDGGPVATLVFAPGAGKPRTVTRAQLQDEVELLARLVSMQVHITPKGVGAANAVSPENPATYRHEFVVHADGRHQMNSFRLEAPTSSTQTGENRRESIRSRNTEVNSQMDMVASRLVQLLELVHSSSSTKCRITQLVTNYVVDRDDNLWLLFAERCETTAETSHESSQVIATANTSVNFIPPSNFLKRKLVSQGGGKTGELSKEEQDIAVRDFGLEPTACATEIANVALVRTGKHRITVTDRDIAKSNEILARYSGDNSEGAKEASEIDISDGDLDAEVESTIAISRKHESETANTRQTLKEFSLAAPGVGFEANQVVKTVGKRLDRRSPDMLGSSQDSQHCPGDFCNVHFDLDTGDKANEEGSGAGNLIDPMLEDGLSGEGSGALEADAKSDLLDAKAGRVFFKSIAQARAEKRLVELLIKRVQRKERGDYIQSVSDLESIRMEKDFPANFYREVKVCQNCFKLYQAIEDARRKAINKIDEDQIELRAKLANYREKRKSPRNSPAASPRAGFQDRRVHPFSEQGRKLMKKSNRALQKLAMERAMEGAKALTKADLAEFRSLKSPPIALIQVGQALMILLTGKAMTWEAIKRFASNGERMMGMILDFDPECIPPQRVADLEPFVRDPGFRPAHLARVSRSAAVLCEYVLGNVQAHKYKAGTAHLRADPLLLMDEDDPIPTEAETGDPLLALTATVDGIASPARPNPLTPDKEGFFLVTIPSYLQEQFQRTQDLQAIKTSAVEAEPLENRVDVQRKRVRQRRGGRPRPSSAEKTGTAGTSEKETRIQSGDASVPRYAMPKKHKALEAQHEAVTSNAKHELHLAEIPDSDYGADVDSAPLSPTGFSDAQHRAIAGTKVGFNRHESLDVPSRNGLPNTRSAPSLHGTSFGVERLLELNKAGDPAMQQFRDHLSELSRSEASRKLSKREMRARRKIQEKQMQRLHSGGVEIPSTSAKKGVDEDESSAKTNKVKTFQCSDGITTMAYDIVGMGGLEGSKPNLVVVHDMFDTFEAMQIFLEPLLRKHSGAQALVFNYPGQAFTSFPSEGTNVLNNAFIASAMHELLVDLEEKGDFSCSVRPFYLMGFGNGVSVASSFASEFGGLDAYKHMLRGLVSLNGYSHVDQQLAAILHSSVNVFSCFPPARPDLPISYFTRFLFSEDYLNAVDPDLVLNIYTAVGNPITLKGRIQLCKGALRHKDVRGDIKKLKIPVVVLQSTEDVLVNPDNVDPFIDGRAVSHLWSHQTFSGKAKQSMRAALSRDDGAFVVWLKAGHEVRQENKQSVTDLVDALLSSCDSAQKSFATGLHASSRAHDKHEQVVKKRGRRARNKKATANGSDTLGSEDRERKEQACPVKASTESTCKTSAASVSSKAVGSKTASSTQAAYTATTEKGTQSDEFEEAMRRHREAKRAADEARQRRLEEARKEEQRRLLEMQDAQHQERLREEEVARQQLEQELEAKRKQQKQELKAQEECMRRELEAEREKAQKLAAKLQRELEEQKIREAEQERALAAERQLRKSLEKGGLNFDRVIGHADAKDESCRQADDTQDQGLESEFQRQIESLKREQEERRRQWEAEDQRRIAILEQQLLKRAGKRAEKEIERRECLSEFQVTDTPPAALRGSDEPRVAVQEEKDSETLEKKVPVVVVTPLGRVDDVLDSATAIENAKSINHVVKAVEQAVENVDLGPEPGMEEMKPEEYERVRQEMMEAEEKRLQEEEEKRNSKNAQIRHRMVIRIQKLHRGNVGRARFADIKHARLAKDSRHMAAIRLQALTRGHLGRKRAEKIKFVVLRERAEMEATRAIQRAGRGMIGRKKARSRRRELSAIKIQSVVRLFLACCEAERVREERRRILREAESATKIQSVWRMRQGREKYLAHRVLELAALQVQRVYRGCRGRRKAERKRTWENAEPGPERLELGLTLIEESKLAFAAQQEEIDALHRAQESAETRVSKIHAGLEESEKELAVLEQELRDVDQLDEALHQLTHEKALHDAQMEAEERQARSRKAKGGPGSVAEVEAEAAKKRAAESYALEMQIHIKRAERERRKKELEAEFAAVFNEVEKKKSELRFLEENIQDMENTRKRKEREFQRLQRNLMELLEEQKNELDNLRERGIELEAATATSAAAAAATAAAAKENEERSKQMFTSTEELLKFQFMSMSLSYFSSINMLKNLRDINSDTTHAAISSSADTAAAAAAAAEAANIPSFLGSKMSEAGVAQAKLKEKKAEMEVHKEIEDARKALTMPFPEDVRKWTVQDVGRWLDTLSLSQYKPAFQEACIDGEFLMELRVEDMRDILGMKHALHVQKVDIARNKLRPLNEQERKRKEAVQWEAQGEQRRAQLLEQSQDELVPDAETVFSQIRNGRFNRVEKALDMGFDANETDSHGNTALIIACQNLNKRITELLLNRGANVNHQNSTGNTAMHYAMSYDPEGTLGEFLIGRGADDTLENQLGLSPYDGIE